MWELDYKESWAQKNWCFRTVVLEKTLQSPLDCKEIQPVHPKDQSWVFIGSTDVEAETPILWPPDVKSWLIGKDPDAGKDWGQEEKGTTEDEMAGWHHRLSRHGFGWTLGVGDGQGGQACCSSWGCKESDTTERLNWIQQLLFLDASYPHREAHLCHFPNPFFHVSVLADATQSKLLSMGVGVKVFPSFRKSKGTFRRDALETVDTHCQGWRQKPFLIEKKGVWKLASRLEALAIEQFCVLYFIFLVISFYNMTYYFTLQSICLFI